MNQLFDPRRFWLLLKLHYAENGKNYLISSAVLIGSMLLFMLPVIIVKGYSSLLEILHFLALFMSVLLGGSLVTSYAFTQYSTPSKGIPALMVPASRLEKFLVAWLFYIVFTATFLVIFWELHHSFLELANRRLPANGRQYHSIPPGPTTFITYLFFLIQGGVFLGSIFFAKLAYVKTAAVLLMVGTVAFTLNYALANHFALYPQDLFTFPFTSWRVNWRYSIAYPEPVSKLIWAFLILLVVSLWGIAYVRLKEKEI